MTNEELVLMVQGGDSEALLMLWHQVERLVISQARRWAGFGGTTTEDLCQSGFIALLRAVDTYDPGKAKFSTYLFPILQTEFAITTGQRTTRTQRDLLHSAISLDTPLTDDDDDANFGDIIPDPAAETAFLAVEHDDLHNALKAALNTLQPEERNVIYARYFQDHTQAEIAAAEGISRNAVCQREQKAMMRLRHPSRSKMLMAYL